MKFLLISTCFHFVRQFHMTNGQTVTQDILPISLSISFFCAFPSSIRGLLNDAGCLMRQRKQLKQHNNNKRNSLPLKIIHPSCQIPPFYPIVPEKRGEIFGKRATMYTQCIVDKDHTRHVPLCHLEQPHGERARQHETTGHHAIKYNIKTVGANTLCVTSIRDCTRPF